MTPQVFAPGLVSLTGRRETKIAFSPDGRECLIGTSAGFLHARQERGHWTEIQSADFLGAGGGAEPFFSPDGRKLFFIRDADIWVSARMNESWAIPQRLASPLSSGAEEWHPSVASDGTLYFCSSRDRPRGGYDIFRSECVGGAYAAVEKLDATINTRDGAWDPYIAADESYMIFSSDRADGFGQVDQYIAYRQDDGSWSAPANLGEVINTEQVEYGAYVGYDGKYFFFSRFANWSGGVPVDLYWVDARAVGIPSPP